MSVASSKCNFSDNTKSAAQIFADHGSFIQTVINCRVKDRHLRKDIYHDFFLELVKRPIPADISNIKSYLYKAVCNDIYDAMRKIKRYKQHLFNNQMLSDRVLVEPAVDDCLIASEEARKMFKIIETNLPSKQADVLKLRHQKDLSNSEIAKNLNVGRSTVSVYYSTGIKKLRGILEKETSEVKHE